MLTIHEAEQRIKSAFAAYSPMPIEHIALAAAQNRVLAEAVMAPWSQPRTALSAMDGYAVRASDTESPTSHTERPLLKLVGEMAAGQKADAIPALKPMECVRIFTGGVVPPGADAILLQEDAEIVTDAKAQGQTYIRAKESVAPSRHIRPAGLDYQHGAILLAPTRVLTARDLALAASANYATLAVRMKPRVGILATGDEILRLGQAPELGQIIGGNGYYLAGLITAAGGTPVMLDIAPDRAAPLQEIAAAARHVDILVTTGGASVGDYDLVKSALGNSGLDLDFWKLAMRPGKPIIFGHYQNIPFFGLPGNPVSSAVCGLLFVWPAIQHLLGRPMSPHPTQMVPLANKLPANDQRQDYLRAKFVPASKIGAKGENHVQIFTPQDSSMMKFLAEADGLIIRPPFAKPAEIGDLTEFLPFPIGV